MSARARVSASVAPLLLASFGAIAWHDASAQSRWSVRDLGTLGGRSSAAEGISDRGVVIGNSDVASRSTHAFVWENGAMRDLGTLGGPSSSVAGAEGDCYAVGASSVDGRGEVVGWSALALEGGQGKDVAQHAFLWNAGKVRDLGMLGGMNSCAVAINASGVLIGKSQTRSSRATAWPYGDTQPFVWERGRMRRLSLGGTDGWATSISDGGVVISWS